MKLIPADQFTIEQLTDAYNQTRVDYIVPMPMNATRLQEYIDVYDIELAASWVAVNEDEEPLGLGMLGVRPGRSWITRLGVLPRGRRQGVGRAIMEHLINASLDRGITTVWLEVIKGNKPAHALFRKFGFEETRDLLIVRRAPDPEMGAPAEEEIAELKQLNHEESLAVLPQRKNRPNWLKETESFHNVPNLRGLQVVFKDGRRGWAIYQGSMYQIKRVTAEATIGPIATTTSHIMQLLHQQQPTVDAITENLPADDPRWPGFQEVGYFETFSRIEMVLKKDT